MKTCECEKKERKRRPPTSSGLSGLAHYILVGMFLYLLWNFIRPSSRGVHVFFFFFISFRGFKIESITAQLIGRYSFFFYDVLPLSRRHCLYLPIPYDHF